MRTQTKRKLKKLRQLMLKRTDFSIISNNCWGGICYRHFGLPYLSPTVGTIIPPRDYTRFCADLRYYQSQPVIPLDPQLAENKAFFQYLENKSGNLVFGKCGDVEICFRHYATFEEAVEKWSRRFARVNFDCLIFKNNDNNGMTDHELLAWNEAVKDYPSVFISADPALVHLSGATVKLLSQKVLPGQNAVDDVSDFAKSYSYRAVINRCLKR